MMFGQLSNRESLRDLIVSFEAHRVKQYHLGLGRNPIAKATLAYANQNRGYPLCLATFPWAKFRKKKGGVKAHVLYDIEAQAPAFHTVTTASKHDSTAMPSIHYETCSIRLISMMSKNSIILF